MSQATAPTPAVPSDPAVPLLGGQAHFLLRRLHSLTGIAFGGYIVVHLLVNATMIQGGNVFRIQVGKIHSLPFLWAIEWLFIYLPIIYHAGYGLWITVTGQPNVGNYPYGKNWAYLLQRVSAVILVAFILFHVLGMKGLLGSTLSFSQTDPTGSVARHINCNWLVAYVVYPIGVLAATYHLANGFWTAAITWGLTVSAAAQRRWGYLCGLLFVLTTVCGMLAIIAAIHNRSLVLH